MAAVAAIEDINVVIDSIVVAVRCCQLRLIYVVVVGGVIGGVVVIVIADIFEVALYLNIIVKKGQIRFNDLVMI